ncbi:MAG: hypothetical protein Q7R56_02820, partial [Nanoarchaeota archaeon]|nr:hypothetical protein [Nanoarchaeota archaeon]
RIKKGTSSGSINPQETFYKTPGEVLLNKYKIQVNDIRKEGDTVRMFIERDGIAETRALQQGQALYPGSVWKVASITKGIPTPTTKTTAKKTTTKTPACTWSKGKSGFVSTTSTTWNYRLVTENCREKTVTLTFKTKDTTQTIVRRIDLDQQEIVTSFKNPPIKSEDIKVTFKAPATTTTNQQETTIESSCFINEKLSKFIDLGAGNNNYRLVTKNCIGKTIRTTFSKGGTILEKKDLVITKDTEEFSITINQQIDQFSIKVAYTITNSKALQLPAPLGATTLTEDYTMPEGITFSLPIGTILQPNSLVRPTSDASLAVDDQGLTLTSPIIISPGGTIPAGTILPKGTVLPAG